MTPKETKLNSMRLLDAKKIPYITHRYDAAFHSADEVAEMIGLPASQVFKTLVVLGDKQKTFLALIPANAELDLKKMARAVSHKKLRMAKHSEAEILTGLQVGGISALALVNKGFSVVLDISAHQHKEIAMSGGQRGINLQLRVLKFTKLVHAQTADIAHFETESPDQAPDVKEIETGTS